MPARMLLVIPALAQGGAERQILELGRRLTGSFDVTLCTLFQDNHYAGGIDPKIRHVDLGLRQVGARTAFGKLKALIHDERPDVVQSFMDQANLWVRLAAVSSGRPYPRIVTSVRGPWMRLQYLALEGILSRLVGRAVIVNSRSTAEEMISWARVPPSRLRIVHNFVDFDAFQPAPPEARAAARARFGLGGDDLVLLLSGRLSPQKNHLGLTVALRRLRKQGRLPGNLKILFAGRARDAWYARLVGPALRWARVDSFVRTIGSIAPPDIPALYAASDVLLLPSLWEGLPNVALEAQACGLPAVVSDKANAETIVEDGVTGFVAPLGLRMRAYADALGRMLALSPEERAAMGERGRQRVRRLFDPPRVLEDFLAIYRAVLDDRDLPVLTAPLARQAEAR